jgi:hypothetical protein
LEAVIGSASRLLHEASPVRDEPPPDMAIPCGY